MRELSWKQAVGITLLLLVVVVTGVYLVSPKQEQASDEELIKEMKYKEDHDRILYVETGVVTPGNTVIVWSQETTGWYTPDIFPGKYIFRRDVEYSYDTENYQILEIKKAVYTVCDLKTGKEIKTIDIKEIAERVKPGEEWGLDLKFGLTSRDIIAGKNGEIYLKFTLRDKSDPYDTGNATWRKLYVNVETGESMVRRWEYPLEEAETLYGEPEGDQQENAHSTSLLDEIELAEANGFASFYCEYDEEEQPGLDAHKYKRGYDVLEIKTLKKYLPEHNEKLYGEFPGLKEYEGDDDDIITLYVAANTTVEEVFEWVLEDGEEISFEGCVLPGEYTTDGKDHEINSFEELDQWYE